MAQRLRTWTELTGQVVGIEQHTDFLCQAGALCQEKLAIRALPWSFPEAVLWQVACLVVMAVLFIASLGEPHHEAVGILPSCDSLPQEPAGFHHLERHQPVEPREGCLFDQLLTRLLGRETGLPLVSKQRFKATPGLRSLRDAAEHRILSSGFELPARQQTVDPFELLADFCHQQLACFERRIVDGSRRFPASWSDSPLQRH